MNKSQRIYFNTGTTVNDGTIDYNKHTSIKLEQDIETLEFMSMSLGTTDVYNRFNSDYGVLVGRVLANGGIGVSNAKISIFIPLTEEDELNEELYSVYPYKTPRDENTEGKRYNLLPRVSRKNPNTNQLEPKQAFGSFPIKEEVVANPPFLEAYKKYYKYTALTNRAGDYMIFGVPTGTQVVHMSCDITDIGEYSMNPASMITNLGYSQALFTDRGTKIKPSNDLGDLPNIETQEITVDVIPFWGDVENFEVGISRQDFRIRAILTNTFTIFGSAFTDSDQTMRGTEDNDDPRQKEIRDLFFVKPKTWHPLALATKRIGTIKETIYFYPSDMTDNEIDNAEPQTDMQVLDKSQYSVYTRNGDFVFIINCNRDRVVTDEFGNQIPVDYDNPNGVFTTFKGFVTLEYGLDELPIVATSGLEEGRDGDVKEKDRTLPLRLKFKFPQHAAKGKSFDYRDDNDAQYWRELYMNFEAQKFYSFSKFHPCLSNNANRDSLNWGLKEQITGDKGGFFKEDGLNNTNTDGQYNIGPIHTEDFSDYDNSDYDMMPNYIGSPDRFGANWLNLSVYFPQTGYALTSRSQIQRVRTADFLATQWEDRDSANAKFVFDNSMQIAAGQTNMKWYGRSDLHWTDIIEVPLDDIIFFRTKDKGFKAQSSFFDGLYRNGTYTPPTTDWKKTWSGACPYNGGGSNGTPGGTDNYFYFYKGFDTADCIEFLYDLGLVT